MNNNNNNNNNLIPKNNVNPAFGSRSEEALPAYHTALSLRPRYARGWLNLGISHANLGRNASAARCYLAALRLNPGATHIWNYLRMVFTNMERYDLVQKAAAQDPDAFLDEFPPIPEGNAGFEELMAAPLS